MNYVSSSHEKVQGFLGDCFEGDNTCSEIKIPGSVLWLKKKKKVQTHSLIITQTGYDVKMGKRRQIGGPLPPASVRLKISLLSAVLQKEQAGA